MARVPLPGDTCEVIARKALANAKRDIYRRGWKSASALGPVGYDGRVGLSSTMLHLIKQNSGFGPFVMWWVKNRTVPLGCAQGDGPHFRFGNPDSVGTAGYVDIPHVGRRFKPVRWRHPGLKPKRFMESAISSAIRDSRREVRESVMRSLRGGGDL